ncbi:hypothetical protein WA026_000681 [Henosepilachna vigintioctopunctata]|uniref:ATP synthase F1 subunit epsilon n=1 Tax=Henosepilachna vigintioctopunctata TaxID=420089 RepID=A0AAW1V4X4_9CUCU
MINVSATRMIAFSKFPIPMKLVFYNGSPGNGDGKGGGGEGSIREAGGAFGKMQAAREEEYFYKKQKEQLKNLKSNLKNEIEFHEEQIKRHQEAIDRHKKTMDESDS